MICDVKKCSIFLPVQLYNEQKSNLFVEKDGIQPPHDIDKIKERVKTWNEISNILKNS